MIQTNHASPTDMTNENTRRFTVVQTKKQIVKELARQQMRDTAEASAIRPTRIAFEINVIFRTNAWPK